MILTRKLYTIKNNIRLYFSGTIAEDVQDIMYITWEWTEDSTKAYIFHISDAWNVLMYARREFTYATFELTREME